MYATITSERASKGQGGNKFIEIKLIADNTKRIDYATIRFEAEEDEDGTGYRLWVDNHCFMHKYIFVQKSKKQKGKVCDNGYEMPCDICPKDGMGICTT